MGFGLKTESVLEEISFFGFLIRSAPASLSVCKFSLCYPYKMSFLVMSIKQMIIHSNLSKMKNEILPTCLQGNYRNSLGEFRKTSHGVLGAERVNQVLFVLRDDLKPGWVKYFGGEIFFLQPRPCMAINNDRSLIM